MAFADAAQRRLYYAYFAAIGLAVGALMVLVPQAATGGEALIRGWVSAEAGVRVMLLLATARFCVIVASYSTGVPGGIFAPILSLAACVGVAFAAAVGEVMPYGSTATGASVIAAMGGLFTASVRSPLVGVVLTLELTDAYTLTLPLLTTCLASNLAAYWLGGKPIYSQLRDRTQKLAAAKPLPAR